MKSLAITRHERIDEYPLNEVGEYLEKHTTQHPINCVNWPDVANYQPQAFFHIAHSGQAFYLHFKVRGEDLRAIQTEPLSPVSDDSCVEFFMRVPGEMEYWNFEFNCIGTVNASHRVERPAPVRLSEAEIASIGRCGSCGIIPFEEKTGVFEWTLTVKIPFDLLHLDKNSLPDQIMANVYKCANKTSHPHYLSWAPIDTPTPNFHVTSAFAPMILE